MSTNNWKELSPEQKIQVLNWAKEGLIKQTAGAVGHCAQHAMIRDIQDKASFDPTEFYDRIHPRSRAHWEQIEKYVEVIDEEIHEIRQKMSSDHPAGIMIPDTTDVLASSPPASPRTPAVPRTPHTPGTYKEVLVPPKKATPQYPPPKGGCGNGGK